MAVLPVYNMITVPESNLYFRTDQYQRMTGRTPAEGEKVTVIVARRETPRTEITGESFAVMIKVDANGFQMMDYGSKMNAGYIRTYLSDSNALMDSRLNTINNDSYCLSV